MQWYDLLRRSTCSHFAVWVRRPSPNPRPLLERRSPGKAGPPGSVITDAAAAVVEGSESLSSVSLVSLATCSVCQVSRPSQESPPPNLGRGAPRRWRPCQPSPACWPCIGPAVACSSGPLLRIADPAAARASRPPCKLGKRALQAHVRGSHCEPLRLFWKPGARWGAAAVVAGSAGSDACAAGVGTELLWSAQGGGGGPGACRAVAAAELCPGTSL